MKENRAVKDAVRTLLGRMNAQVVEVEERMDFCNFTTKEGTKERKAELERVRAHCATYETKRVVCYCTGCLNALQTSGVRGVHLMDLITERL